MRSEKEIRQQLAVISKGEMLSVDQIKALVHKPIVRDIRYRDEVAEYWFKWVLNDKSEEKVK